jgi:4-aminobutyrate aminotransferase
LIKDGTHALDEAEKVMYCALSKGVSFKLTMGNIITLTPALIITQKEMDQALDSIEDCIGQVESGTL